MPPWIGPIQIVSALAAITMKYLRLKASDSATCRNCHKAQRMNLALQSRKAQEAHRQISNGKTCIDCHEGIAHSLPDNTTEDEFDF